MPKHLALENEPADRPEWCPEVVWPELVREIALLRAGISRSSVSQIAERCGLEFGQVTSVIKARKFQPNIDEARQQLAVGARYAAEDLAAEAHRRMQAGEHRDSKNVKFIDVIKGAKMMGEYMHDLTKSEPAPQTNIFNHFADLKMVIQNRVQPPVSGE